MFSVEELFKIKNYSSQTGGIEGYYVQNKYEDPLRQKEQKEYLANKHPRKKYQTKRGSYLDDYAKMHGGVPGPGEYNCTLYAWGAKSKLKQEKKKKMTFLDEIVLRAKREKAPAPGSYDLVKSQKQIEKEKKALANQKVRVCDRTTYLDGIEYQASCRPGVGNYNPRPQSANSNAKLKMTPADWKKKHLQQSKKKVPKSPDMGTYSPNIINRKSTSNWGKVKRFRDDQKPSVIGPGQYIKQETWTSSTKVRASSAKSVYYH